MSPQTIPSMEINRTKKLVITIYIIIYPYPYHALLRGYMTNSEALSIFSGQIASIQIYQTTFKTFSIALLSIFEAETFNLIVICVGL